MARGGSRGKKDSEQKPGTGILRVGLCTIRLLTGRH
jgi:hypothetical protein